MKYPIQIAHPFRQGDTISPVVEGVICQTVVKARWPDGTAKHAIFSFYVDGNPGQALSLSFVEGQSLPIGTMALDAAIEVAGVQVKLSDLSMASPLPNARLYADHTGAHDLATDSGTKMRPIFHVTYWPEIQNAQVRFVLENSNTEAAGEAHAPCRLLINGVEVFSNMALTWQQQMIPCGGRLTKTFWLKPQPKVTAKFDLAYMSATAAVPNFDTSVQVAESALANMYQQWGASNKDIAQARTLNWGLFPAAMGSAGARADWGCYPQWSVMSLYTGDDWMREVDEGSAELAAMYAMNWRECRTGKPSTGRPIRIWDRPSLQLSQPTLGADGLRSVADMDAWGLIPDPAHVPNPFFLLYLTTGEYFYLEQMWFWLCYCMAYSNPGFRGPTGATGGIPGADNAIFQTRGQGLILRLLAEAAWITPDDEPEKAYFAQMLDDCLTIWEGERNINPVNDARWQFGRQTFPQDSPLHVWNQGNDGLTQPPVDFTKAAVAEAQWEESVVAYGLNRADELGYPVQPLKDYLTPHFMSLAKWLANYRIATRDSARNYFQTLDEAKAATNIDQDGDPYDVNAWWASQRNLDQGYTTIAGQAVIATGNANLWGWFKADVYNALDFSVNPKWAILPR